MGRIGQSTNQPTAPTANNETDREMGALSLDASPQRQPSSSDAFSDARALAPLLVRQRRHDCDPHLGGRSCRQLGVYLSKCFSDSAPLHRAWRRARHASARGEAVIVCRQSPWRRLMARVYTLGSINQAARPTTIRFLLLVWLSFVWLWLFACLFVCVCESSRGGALRSL